MDVRRKQDLLKNLLFPLGEVVGIIADLVSVTSTETFFSWIQYSLFLPQGGVPPGPTLIARPSQKGN